MKYIPSIAFEEMSGSAKGVTAAKVKSRKYIRNRGYGGSTHTSFQASVKAVFKQLSQAWKGLTNAQILSLLMKVAPIMSDVKLKSYRIPVDGGYYNATIRGMMVLVPDLEMNREQLKTFLPYSE